MSTESKIKLLSSKNEGDKFNKFPSFRIYDRIGFWGDVLSIFVGVDVVTIITITTQGAFPGWKAPIPPINELVLNPNFVHFLNDFSSLAIPYYVVAWSSKTLSSPSRLKTYGQIYDFTIQQCVSIANMKFLYLILLNVLLMHEMIRTEYEFKLILAVCLSLFLWRCIYYPHRNIRLRF
jgi:hypothetical protein